MKRKILSVLLTAAFVAATLAGCGGSAQQAADTAADTVQEAADTAADAAEDVKDAAADTVATVEEAAEEIADAATGSDGAISVGFAQVGHESDWRMAATKSVQDAFSAENGFDLQFVDCDNDSAAQLDAVRNFIQQDVDYIVIDPIVSTGWDTVLQECDDAGIPVIVIDRTIDDSDKYAAWVGSQFENEGLAAGAWLKDYAALKGIDELNILVISGTTGASAQIGRTNGFDKYVEAEGWNKLDEQTGDFTQEGGQEVMESFCKSYAGKFNVVVCQNDNEAFGAEQAMDAAGVSYGVGGDVILISFDACTAGLEEVIAGKINADFQCNPLSGPDCAAIVQKLESGATVDKETFMAEPWYVNESDLTEITYTNASGEEVTEPLIVVTQEIIDADY